MANIKINSPVPVFDGQPVTFKSPAECAQITGLNVYYPSGNAEAFKTFQFADAHGNNVGGKNLFAANVLVKVILDTELNRAYVQNADTNSYLERRFDDKAETITFTVTVNDDWHPVDELDGSTSYYQDISVPGMLATDNPIPGVAYGGDNVANKLYDECFSNVLHITTYADRVQVQATDLPEAAFPLQLKVVR